MAVPGPPVTLRSVYLEFSAPIGAPLHDFRRGGVYVPNVPQNANVPTAPPIRLAQLAGATKYVALSGSINNVSDFVAANVSGYIFGPMQASVSGGTGSYTYTWSYVSGTNFTIISPGAASTNIRHEGHAPQGEYVGHYQCVVSDGVTSITLGPNTVTLDREI